MLIRGSYGGQKAKELTIVEADDYIQVWNATRSGALCFVVDCEQFVRSYV